MVRETGRGVESLNFCESLRPIVLVMLVVDTARIVVVQLFPGQSSVDVGYCAIAVVLIGKRPAGAYLAVLPGSRAGN